MVGQWVGSREQRLWPLESVDVQMRSRPFVAELQKQRWVELAVAVELAVEIDAR